jgi:hypothetical protein
MPIHLTRYLFGFALLSAASFSHAQAATPPVVQQPAMANPPIDLKPVVAQSKLPEPPSGFVWARMPELEVALPAPAGWVTRPQSAEFARVVTLVGTPRLVEMPSGKTELPSAILTARLMWHPQYVPGHETKAMDAQLVSIYEAIAGNKTINTILESSRELRADKKVMVMRYRIAPPGRTAVMAHMVAIGDPRTGFVYQFVFESPESQWEEQWKIGARMVGQLVIMFQHG